MDSVFRNLPLGSDVRGGRRVPPAGVAEPMTAPGARHGRGEVEIRIRSAVLIEDCGSGYDGSLSVPLSPFPSFHFSFPFRCGQGSGVHRIKRRQAWQGASCLLCWPSWFAFLRWGLGGSVARWLGWSGVMKWQFPS